MLRLLIQQNAVIQIGGIVMDRKVRDNRGRRRRYHRQRGLAAWIVICLLLSNLNFGSMLTFATEHKTQTFKIGADRKSVV